MASQISALKLFDLIQSHRVTAVIHVAVSLGSRRCDDPDAINCSASAQRRRALNALATIGISERHEGSYAHGAGASDGEAEQSFKSCNLEAEMLSKRWSGMLELVTPADGGGILVPCHS